MLRDFLRYCLGLIWIVLDVDLMGRMCGLCLDAEELSILDTTLLTQRDKRLERLLTSTDSGSILKEDLVLQVSC